MELFVSYTDSARCSSSCIFICICSRNSACFRSWRFVGRWGYWCRDFWSALYRIISWNQCCTFWGCWCWGKRISYWQCSCRWWCGSCWCRSFSWGRCSSGCSSCWAIRSIGICWSFFYWRNPSVQWQSRLSVSGNINFSAFGCSSWRLGLPSAAILGWAVWLYRGLSRWHLPRSKRYDPLRVRRWFERLLRSD